MPDRGAAGVQDIDGQLALGRGLQHIVDQGAGRRILADGPAGIDGVRIVQPKGRLRRVEHHRIAGGRRPYLAQGIDVVEDPEGPAVGGGDQVVALDHQVVHRHGRQVQLQGLPGAAVVERHEHPPLGAGEQQAPANRILAHHMHYRPVRQASRDRRPTPAAVRCLERIGPDVVHSVPVDGHIGDLGVVRRRFDHADMGPGGHGLGGHIGPMAAAVVRHVH